jgi:hypothetical protein
MTTCQFCNSAIDDAAVICPTCRSAKAYGIGGTTPLGAIIRYAIWLPGLTFLTVDQSLAGNMARAMLWCTLLIVALAIGTIDLSRGPVWNRNWWWRPPKS